MIIERHSLENYNYIIKLLEKELGYTIINSQERLRQDMLMVTLWQFCKNKII
jgi:hypothetical protein